MLVVLIGGFVSSGRVAIQGVMFRDCGSGVVQWVIVHWCVRK